MHWRRVDVQRQVLDCRQDPEQAVVLACIAGSTDANGFSICRFTVDLMRDEGGLHKRACQASSSSASSSPRLEESKNKTELQGILAPKSPPAPAEDRPAFVG